MVFGFVDRTMLLVLCALEVLLPLVVLVDLIHQLQGGHVALVLRAACVVYMVLTMPYLRQRLLSKSWTNRKLWIYILNYVRSVAHLFPPAGSLLLMLPGALSTALAVVEHVAVADPVDLVVQAVLSAHVGQAFQG